MKLPIYIHIYQIKKGEDMEYIGDNSSFRFMNGVCESVPGADISAAAAAEIGRLLAARFGRFCAACDCFSHIPHLYALCSGIADSGKDVYVCENTDLPSLRFSYPLLSADCAVFISGNGCLRLHVFGKNRLPVSGELLAEIFSSKYSRNSSGCGRIDSVTSFRPIYINNIVSSLPDCTIPFSAGISCGKRSVRDIWLSFFSGSDDELLFQVSDEGQNVNAYSAKYGMISDDKLRLAYAVLFSPDNKVILPESFHFAAEKTGLSVTRIECPDHITDSFSLRLLTDPLYVCTNLAADKNAFFRTVEKLPELAAVKREIVIDFGNYAPFRRIINTPHGRLILTRSGINRLSLAVQACSMEAAAEMCSSWSDKLNRMYRCGSSLADL